ncbi:MAG: hypothetical protein ACTS2F_30780 [Thainema sp.]
MAHDINTIFALSIILILPVHPILISIYLILSFGVKHGNILKIATQVQNKHPKIVAVQAFQLQKYSIFMLSPCLPTHPYL